MRISVAIATYNGSRYLLQQLHSLACQSKLPDELIVSDDHSSDDTNLIVEEFRKHAPFPVVHIKNNQRLGFAENFLQAANCCTGDWVLFCDQDDIWLPHKIEVMRRYMKAVNRPYMIAHSARVVDKDLRVIGGKYVGGGPGARRGGMRSSLWNVPPGFCQAVNRQTFALDASERPLGCVGREQRMAHDRWAYFVVSALGEMCRISQPLALYRRHDKTVTGYGREDKLVKPLAESRSLARYQFACQYMDVCDEYAAFWRRKESELSEEYSLKAQRAASLYARAARFYHLRSEIHRPNNNRLSRVQALIKLQKLCDPSLRIATEYSLKQKLLDAATAFLGRPKMREQ